MQDVEERVSKYLVQNFLFGDTSKFPAPSESLVELGIVDSTGILEIIEFLESDFGIQVLDSEALPENLGSMSNIVSFVERKQAQV